MSQIETKENQSEAKNNPVPSLLVKEIRNKEN